MPVVDRLEQIDYDALAVFGKTVLADELIGHLLGSRSVHLVGVGRGALERGVGHEIFLFDIRQFDGFSRASSF